MSTTVWLRISAIISLTFAVGHFMGGLQNWSPVADNPVLESMRAVHFPVMGAHRSYLDFYMGFGYSITVNLLLQAVLLWILSNLARTHASTVRPMIAAFAVATALGVVISWRYIFLIPALFFLVLLGALVIAFISARPGAAIAVPGERP